MSNFANRLKMGSIFNRSAYAGPRRLIVIGGIGALMLGGVAIVSMSGGKPPPVSSTARMPDVNSLPGGLNGNTHQKKMDLQANQEEAEDASSHGLSYTPPIAASVPGTPPESVDPYPTAAASAYGTPVAPVASPVSATPAVVTRPDVGTSPFNADPMVHRVAQTVPVDPAQQTSMNLYIEKLLRGWDPRSPKTDVDVEPGAGSSGDEATGTRARNSNTALASASGSGSGLLRRSLQDDAAGRTLVPAGRGVYAHTILAASSDSETPVILQADSGPLAGDRMIGIFSKASANGGTAADRLVVRINTIEHNGRSIGVDGLVTAPDTMETTVASSVDEHYMSRFLLPAAAAFVQGIGTALATTSNTTQVASGLGGVESFTHLNLPQQLGIAAGVSAAQIGSTLSQEAPKGPTVHLDANANVGVMFLTPVVETSQTQ